MKKGVETVVLTREEFDALTGRAEELTLKATCEYCLKPCTGEFAIERWGVPIRPREGEKKKPVGPLVPLCRGCFMGNASVGQLQKEFRRRDRAAKLHADCQKRRKP